LVVCCGDGSPGAAGISGASSSPASAAQQSAPSPEELKKQAEQIHVLNTKLNQALSSDRTLNDQMNDLQIQMNRQQAVVADLESASNSTQTDLRNQQNDQELATVGNQVQIEQSQAELQGQIQNAKRTAEQLSKEVQVEGMQDYVTPETAGSGDRLAQAQQNVSQLQGQLWDLEQQKQDDQLFTAEAQREQQAGQAATVQQEQKQYDEASKRLQDLTSQYQKVQGDEQKVRDQVGDLEGEIQIESSLYDQ
jgi:hypothetical protein